MSVSVRNYTLITFSYWAFTITDGALRMLVLLYFHTLGYSPLQIASLFLFYELFGIVTNLLGGWIGSHLGLRTTLLSGLLLQILALLMLSGLDSTWPVSFAVAYVTASQALSGIAKDLTKVSAKSALKYVTPDDGKSVFKWVAILTGSKNALKGAGFFLGGLLLSMTSFQLALYSLTALVLVALLLAWLGLPPAMGRSSTKKKFRQLFSKSTRINLLSLARFFLFGARDIWFVIALPLFLSSQLGWSHSEIGSFLALWVIGYGIIQSAMPGLLQHVAHPHGYHAAAAAGLLALVLLLLIIMMGSGIPTDILLITGLGMFALAFAANSAIHSFLIIDYTSHDSAAVDVGFYYMANAAGRLTGTLLSGLLYQYYGFVESLWAALIFIVVSALLALKLPRH